MARAQCTSGGRPCPALKGVAQEGEDTWHKMTGDASPPGKRWELLPGWVSRARGSGRLPGGGGLEPGIRIREQGPGRGSEQPRTQEGLGFLVRKEAPDTGRSANSSHGSPSTDHVQTIRTALNRPHLH